MCHRIQVERPEDRLRELASPASLWFLGLKHLFVLGALEILEQHNDYFPTFALVLYVQKSASSILEVMDLHIDSLF